MIDRLIDWTLSASEALCNALHKFKTYLFTTACGSQSYTTVAATAGWTAVRPQHNITAVAVADDGAGTKDVTKYALPVRRPICREMPRELTVEVEKRGI